MGHDTLVVFYSGAGRTRRIAHELARLAGADLEDLQFRVPPREGWRGYLYSAFDAISRHRPALAPLEYAPEDYELCIVGTPIWSWRMASPVRSWLSSHAGRLRKVAFFCTMSTSGAPSVFREMSRVARQRPAAMLALTSARVDAGQYRLNLEDFVKRATTLAA